MSARHRQPVSPAQARVRALVLGLIAIFLIGFVFLRGEGKGGSPSTTDPLAGETTTTLGDNSTTPGSTDSTPGTDASGSSTTGGPALPELQSISLDVVYEGFQQPTVLTAPVGDTRLFVAQRVGVIRILDENYEVVDPAFLAIDDRVLAGGIEQGLLGLAFHPDYATNGKFYVYYTDKGGRRQLSEFTVSATNPNRADPDSERVLFEFDQPEGSTDIRHYAGQLAFGPDGYLYTAQGDGADSRDQGQNPDTMYAAISRIDVDTGDPYGIPPENPFVDGGGAPEVWAYGLRNPWRFSIDPVDGLIYIADVGHADQEEINVLPISEGGFNLGWSDVEGTRCFHVQDCDLTNYTAPVLIYFHGSEADQGCSITGGYVYRGSEIPELHGTYFYSDWCTQWIKSFKYVGGAVTEEKDWTSELGTIGQINSFGLSGTGELYAVTYDGKVAKFTANR
ncbi:MAG: PQQ-dependent sugar dehydrogenase [Acidimicrobiia bacterium]|nr:PQQ-dependent sugar dehydrogenase [Acidimicrobiia bacterium]MDH3462839.1 PQQ-dependent sugar dehydrogenase [Acidimicrobiia bacterium]